MKRFFDKLTVLGKVKNALDNASMRIISNIFFNAKCTVQCTVQELAV